MNLIKDTLFWRYINERLGQDIIENESAFIIYKINGKECFMVDMGVERPLRGQGKASEIFAELVAVAKSHGCEVITGNVHIKTPGADHMLALVLGAGGKIERAENDILLVFKDISEVSNG